MSGVAATVAKKVENKKFSQMAFDCYLIRDHFFLTLELPQSLIFFASLLPTSAASSSFFIWISLEIELRKKHSLCPHVQLFLSHVSRNRNFLLQNKCENFFFFTALFFNFLCCWWKCAWYGTETHPEVLSTATVFSLRFSFHWIFIALHLMCFVCLHVCSR